MKDEIRRIMQLVKDGKLSPEDAAELVQAFSDAQDDDDAPVEETASDESAASEPTDDAAADAPPSDEATGEKSRSSSSPSDDPFAKMLEAIEKLGKDVANNVDWKDISTQVRDGVSKGVEAVRQAAEKASKGKGPFGSVFGAQERKKVELPLAVPEGKVLRIDANDGDISIKGGHDVGSVSIDAAFRAYNDEEAQKMADRFMPVLLETDDEIVLRIDDPAGVSADIEIVMPKGIPVRIKNTSGDIDVSGTQNSVKIQNASGDIRVDNGGNVVSIATSKGLTKVLNTTAKTIEVESKSGEIVLEKCDASCVLKTSSGDIYAYECAARTMAAEAASGDIALDMTKAIEGAYNLRTVSGDIRLEVPDGSNTRINLSTLRGSVFCNFELDDESRDRMKITGRMGAGEGTVDISAVNGDVTLQLRDGTIGE